MTDYSGRREVIAALGGVAASSILWPLPARAQQPERIRRVAVLMAYVENDPEGQVLLRTFATALEELGGKAGRNVLVECRWGGSDIDRIRTFAKELLALQPDVIQSRLEAAILPPRGGERGLRLTCRSIGADQLVEIGGSTLPTSWMHGRSASPVSSSVASAMCRVKRRGPALPGLR